jgi:hypothetical protein
MTDWYMTIPTIAGLNASAIHTASDLHSGGGSYNGSYNGSHHGYNGVTGPLPPDGHDLWEVLLSGGASPRQEVLHLPLPNAYVDTTLDQKGNDCSKAANGRDGCSPSMRVGDYKIIFGWPGSDELCHLPPPLTKPVHTQRPPPQHTHTF